MFSSIMRKFKEYSVSKMKYINKYQNSIKIALLLSIGFGAFLLITNIAILDPRNFAWLMKADPATHFLGWQFFRTSPVFQWPYGANPNYGMEIGSSIVYTDSIPLLACLFKLISSYLPTIFQYFGLWILLCFLLQSYFAWKLLTKFTRDMWLPLLGSAFFVIAPFLLWRLYGHYALFGQWVLLAALHLYFKNKYSTVVWIILLSATALIHGYLLAMVLAIWSADMAQRMLIKEMSLLRIAASFSCGMSTTIFIMWFAGYFMIENITHIGGFGLWRMNLLAPIDPDDIWSGLLNDQKGGGNYAGSHFWGIGMIGLALIAVYEFMKNPKTLFHIKFMPILVLSLLFFLYAISNRIVCGSQEIFAYSLPSFMNIITGTFRVSERFFWPVSYLIYLFVFYILFTRIKRRMAIVICVFALIFQVIDSRKIFAFFNNKFGKTNSYSSPLRSPEWDKIAENYKKVVFVLPEYFPRNWIILSEFAVAHRMPINIGYFARIDENKLHKVRTDLTNSIINNDLDPDALYFFGNDACWNVATAQLRKSDFAGVKDGFHFIAPKFKDADAFNNIKFTYINNCKFNEKIYFNTNGSGAKYILSGWSVAEPWGIWSDGNSSMLCLNLPESNLNDLILIIEGQAFLPENHPLQEIDVYLKDHYLTTMKYSARDNAGVRSIKIPKELISGNSTMLL